MAIELTKNICGSGAAFIVVTGLTPVPALTTGGVETIDFSQVKIDKGILLGIGVECDSTKYDFVIGTAPGIDFEGTKAFCNALLCEYRINKGGNVWAEGNILLFHEFLYVRIDNGSPSATGIIGLRIDINY